MLNEGKSVQQIESYFDNYCKKVSTSESGNAFEFAEEFCQCSIDPGKNLAYYLSEE